MEYVLIGVVVVIIIFIIFLSAKNNNKKGRNLLESYRKQTASYEVKMQNDLNLLKDERRQIASVIKEYNSKKSYIMKHYENLSREVRGNYSSDISYANRYGDAREMNRLKMAQSRETSALTGQKNNELKLLRDSYGDVFNKNRQVNKDIKILKIAFKLNKKNLSENSSK